MDARISQLLIDEWNYEKNKDLSPYDVMPMSNKKIWWVCKECKYEWEATINSRSRGTGCPICGRKKNRESLNQARLRKSGTLLDKFPFIAEEWNYERNEDLSPSDVTPFSNKKVWWICREGHEWQTTVNARSSGRGCPVCSKERGTSFPEQAIFYYLNKSIGAENRYKYDGVELDIYIPTINVGIEYDGYFYHGNTSGRERDARKTAFFKEKGIRLIRIIESKDNAIFDDVISCVYDSSYKYLNGVIKSLLKILNIGEDILVDIEKDRPIILEQYYSYAKENSIARVCPTLLDDWDYDVNGRLNPEYIPYGSNQKIAWKCNICGYKWRATVVSRFAGNGCSACSGKVLVLGKNDLLSQNPELALEWNYERNAPLKPNEVTVNNGKKVWWICKICGYSWKATVAHRNSGRICPECAKQKVIETRLRNKRAAEGSLATLFPDVAKEWNYEKNGEIIPENLTAHSGMKVWWKCLICETEWEAYVSNRVKGHGCPTCFKKMQAERSIRTAFKRNGSIAESNPEILEFWNYKLNENITPEMVTRGSHTKVWWLCPTCGNAWQSMVANLVKGQRCPNCSRTRKRRVLQIDSNENIIAEFESLAEAERVTGILKSSISQAANGKKKTSGGYVWRFKDEH